MWKTNELLIERDNNNDFKQQPINKFEATTTKQHTALNDILSADIIARNVLLYLKFRHIIGFNEPFFPYIHRNLPQDKIAFSGWNLPEQTLHDPANVQRIRSLLGTIFSSCSQIQPVIAGLHSDDLNIFPYTYQLEFFVDCPSLGFVHAIPHVLLYDIKEQQIMGGPYDNKNLKGILEIFPSNTYPSPYQLRRATLMVILGSIVAGCPIPVYLSNLETTTLVFLLKYEPNGSLVVTVSAKNDVVTVLQQEICNKKNENQAMIVYSKEPNTFFDDGTQKKRPLLHIVYDHGLPKRKINAVNYQCTPLYNNDLNLDDTTTTMTKTLVTSTTPSHSSTNQQITPEELLSKEVTGNTQNQEKDFSEENFDENLTTLTTTVTNDFVSSPPTTTSLSRSFSTKRRKSTNSKHHSNSKRRRGGQQQTVVVTTNDKNNDPIDISNNNYHDTENSEFVNSKEISTDQHRTSETSNPQNSPLQQHIMKNRSIPYIADINDESRSNTMMTPLLTLDPVEYHPSSSFNYDDILTPHHENQREHNRFRQKEKCVETKQEKKSNKFCCQEQLQWLSDEDDKKSQRKIVIDKRDNCKMQTSSPSKQKLMTTIKNKEQQIFKDSSKQVVVSGFKQNNTNSVHALQSSRLPLSYDTNLNNELRVQRKKSLDENQKQQLNQLKLLRTHNNNDYEQEDEKRRNSVISEGSQVDGKKEEATTQIDLMHKVNHVCTVTEISEEIDNQVKKDGRSRIKKTPESIENKKKKRSKSKTLKLNSKDLLKEVETTQNEIINDETETTNLGDDSQPKTVLSHILSEIGYTALTVKQEDQGQQSSQRITLGCNNIISLSPQEN